MDDWTGIDALRRQLTAAALALPLGAAICAGQAREARAEAPDAKAEKGEKAEKTETPAAEASKGEAKARSSDVVMKWCGSPADAWALNYGDKTDACPVSLAADKFAAAHPEKTLPDINGVPRINVRLVTDKDGKCCYEVTEIPVPEGFLGRPLRGPRGPIVSSLRVPVPAGGHGSAHVLRHSSGPGFGDASVPARIAREWLGDALVEHASIASFERAAAELRAVGAPAHLLDAVARAAADEVRHTQACLALARAYGAPAVEPAPLAVPAPRGGGLPRVAADTFVEGCVGETIGALLAARAAESCRVAPVPEALVAIARDEAEHAQLAWATLGWALRTGGDAVRAAIGAVATPPHVRAAADPDAAALAAHGRLDAATRAQIAAAAWERVIAPTLADLLASA